MSATKRIDGDYNIISTNKTVNNSDPGFAKVFVDTNLLHVTGDMLVNGEATFIDKSDVTISDNTIILNEGETSAGVTALFSGIEVDRGTSNNSDLLWDEALDQWTVDLGDTVRKNILVALPSQGPALHNVVEDLTPQLGGALDVNGSVITALTNSDVVLTVSGTGEIRADGPLVVSGTEPASVAAGDVALYQGADGGGGTQVYYKNDTDTDELVSKTKAITYSLIF